MAGFGRRRPRRRRPAMPGPAPTYRPTFTAEDIATCERLLRRPTAPQAQVARARLALLLHAQPDLDTAAAGRQPTLPPLAVATVKALACALPAQREQPLSRSSTADLVRSVEAQPAAPPVSASTSWRLLDQDPLKPWQHRSWITPRDPAFASKAGRVLDLYAGRG